jgi:hypothetical protein
VLALFWYHNVRPGPHLALIQSETKIKRYIGLSRTILFRKEKGIHDSRSGVKQQKY